MAAWGAAVWRTSFAVVLLTVMARYGGAQTSTPAVSGVVRDTAAQPVGGAHVFISRTAGVIEDSATSGPDGRFAFHRLPVASEYLLTISATGYRPVRRRIEAVGFSQLREVIITLHARLTMLEAVAVRADAAKPLKVAFVYDIGVGALTTAANGSAAAAAPALSSLADRLRTDLFVDQGAALGGAAGETQLELNGLRTRLVDLPRSLPVAVKSTVAEYDVAVGGFAGGRVNIEPQQAGEFALRSVELVRETGARAFRGNGLTGASANVSGRSILDVGGTSRVQGSPLGVSWGVRAASLTRSQISIADAGPGALESAGIQDSQVRLVTQLAQRAGVFGRPASRNTMDLALTGLTRVDFLRPGPRVNALVASLSRNTSSPLVQSFLASPSTAVGARRRDVALQHLFRIPTGANAAWDVRTGLAWISSAGTSRASDLGTTLVTVNGRIDTQDPSAESFLVGRAAGAPVRDQRTAELAIEREANFASGRTRGTWKALISARSDVMTSRIAPLAATVAFPSLSDFASRSNAFGVISSAEPLRGQAEKVTAGVGSTFKVNTGLSVSVGARADAQRFGARLPSGTAASAVRSVDVSPRLGVTWHFAPSKSEGPGFMQSTLLSRQLVPPGVLRFGIGRFVADYAAGELGLAGATLQAGETTSCQLPDGFERAGGNGETFGPSEIRDACGTSDAEFVRTGRTVRLNAQDFRPPVSDRVTVSFVSRIGWMDIRMDAVGSMTTRLPSSADRAVSETEMFSMRSEGQRQVYEPFDQWLVARGAVLIGGNGAPAQPARDVSVSSATQSRVGRLAIQLASSNAVRRVQWRLGYAVGRSSIRENGFDRDVGNDVRQIEWAAARSDRRHQVQLEVGSTLAGITASLWLRAASGLPYTPVVDGDVNGDGIAGNDRAFIVPTSDAAEGMAAASASVAPPPRSAADCVAKQIGRLASRGSCRTAWSASSNLLLTVNPWIYFRKRGFPITLSVENPLGLLASAVRSRALAELSTATPIDPVLYRIRTARQSDTTFTYTINPNFGRPSLGSRAVGSYAVTIAVRLPFSQPIRRQQLNRWLDANGVGARMSADSLAQRLAKNVPSALRGVVDADDELALTATQREQLQTRARALEDSLASIWRAAAVELLENARDRGAYANLQRLQRATNAAWDVNWHFTRVLQHTLSPLQQSLLPWPASALANAKAPIHFDIVYY